MAYDNSDNDQVDQNGQETDNYASFSTQESSDETVNGNSSNSGSSDSSVSQTGGEVDDDITTVKPIVRNYQKPPEPPKSNAKLILGSIGVVFGFLLICSIIGFCIYLYKSPIGRICTDILKEQDSSNYFKMRQCYFQALSQSDGTYEEILADLITTRIKNEGRKVYTEEEKKAQGIADDPESLYIIYLYQQTVANGNLKKNMIDAVAHNFINVKKYTAGANYFVKLYSSLAENKLKVRAGLWNNADEYKYYIANQALYLQMLARADIEESIKNGVSPDSQEIVDKQKILELSWGKMVTLAEDRDPYMSIAVSKILMNASKPLPPFDEKVLSYKSHILRYLGNILEAIQNQKETSDEVCKLMLEVNRSDITPLGETFANLTPGLQQSIGACLTAQYNGSQEAGYIMASIINNSNDYTGYGLRGVDYAKNIIPLAEKGYVEAIRDLARGYYTGVIDVHFYGDINKYGKEGATHVANFIQDSGKALIYYENLVNLGAISYLDHEDTLNYVNLLWEENRSQNALDLLKRILRTLNGTIKQTQDLVEIEKLNNNVKIYEKQLLDMYCSATEVKNTKAGYDLLANLLKEKDFRTIQDFIKEYGVHNRYKQCFYTIKDSEFDEILSAYMPEVSVLNELAKAGNVELVKKLHRIYKDAVGCDKNYDLVRLYVANQVIENIFLNGDYLKTTKELDEAINYVIQVNDLAEESFANISRYSKDLKENGYTDFQISIGKMYMLIRYNTLLFWNKIKGGYHPKVRDYTNDNYIIKYLLKDSFKDLGVTGTDIYINFDAIKYLTNKASQIKVILNQEEKAKLLAILDIIKKNNAKMLEKLKLYDLDENVQTQIAYRLKYVGFSNFEQSSINFLRKYLEAEPEVVEAAKDIQDRYSLSNVNVIITANQIIHDYVEQSVEHSKCEFPTVEACKAVQSSCEHTGIELPNL